MGGTGDGKYGKGSWQRDLTLGVSLMFLSMGGGGLSPTPAGAEPDLHQELEALKAQLERDRLQMEQDRQRIEQLEHQFESVEVKSEQKSKALEEKITKQALSPPTFEQSLDRFAGEHRLSIVGYGFGGFEWQERANTNTFMAGFEPIFLYRLSDRLLFEGDLELKLEETETSVDLEYAQVDYLLNDYMTVVAGKFLLPFGEFIERQHQVWINKLAGRGCRGASRVPAILPLRQRKGSFIQEPPPQAADSIGLGGERRGMEAGGGEKVRCLKQNTEEQGNSGVSWSGASRPRSRTV